MTESHSQTARRFEFYRTKKFYLLVAGLAILTVTPVSAYYAMSYNSVNGSTVQLISVQRTVLRGFSGSISSVKYYVQAHVWSWAASLDTRVTNPIFSLTVDSYFVNSMEAISGTFKPYSYLTYSLTFTTLDSVVAAKVGQASSSHVTLGMSALLSAGMYLTQRSLSDAGTWTFSD